jgi:ethanolamine ammonia-lyase small subunit
MSAFEDDSHSLPEHSGSASRPERSGVERSAVPALPAEQHPLARLRQFTAARIVLGRAGNSLPTRELLDFGADHAMARDAVHASLDGHAIAGQLAKAGLESLRIHSAAPDRATYLRRPDLGRRLDHASRGALSALQLETGPDVLFVIADGLSAIAPARYAVAVVEETRKLLGDAPTAPVLIAEQARVALGDEAGEILGAEIVVVLIGERPGLSSPDSLGIYLTWQPKIGRSDAERNCISNVRAEGMSPLRAAQTLHHLIANARRLQLSGVELKDDFDPASSVLAGETAAHKQLKSSAANER